MKITSYVSSSNNAFTDVGRNPDFIGSRFDYSFVGIIHNSSGHKKIVTLVGPRQIISAAHYPVNIGDVVEFYNRNGDKVRATVSSGRADGDVVAEGSYDDIQVSELDVDVRQQLVTIATFTNYHSTDYRGKPTLCFGLEETTREVVAAKNTVLNFQFAGKYSAVITQSQRKGVQVSFGDSGAPDFIINNGSLELIGPHYSVTPMLYYTSVASPVVSQFQFWSKNT